MTKTPLIVLAVVCLAVAFETPPAQSQSTCDATCDPWYWQPDPSYCGGTHRWQRLCHRGGQPVWQQTCSAVAPGSCPNNSSFVPTGSVDGCSGVCDPWYWQSNPGSCGSSHRWVRLCRSSGDSVHVWEETCSSIQPSSCSSASSCMCFYGADFNSTSIDPASTYCGYRVCGADNQYYECGAQGWRALGGSCPVAGEAPANNCTYNRTGGAVPFPTGTMAVKAVNFFPGEHIQERLWTQWDYELIREDLDVAQTIGFNALRVLLHESAIGNAFDANSQIKVDRLICEAQSRGMRIIFTLLPSSGDYPCGNDLTAGSRAWMQRVIDRYRLDPNVILWELSNEPKCNGEWNDIAVPVQDRLAADLTWMKGRTSQSVSVPVLQDHVDNLTPNFVNASDVINFHLYDQDPDLRPSLFGGYFSTAVSIAGGKPIFIGETGCLATAYDPNAGQQATRYCNDGDNSIDLEQDQAAWFEEVFNYSNSHGVAGFAPWLLSEPTIFEPGSGAQNSEYGTFPAFGIIRLDNSLKPAADRLRILF